MMKRWRKHRLIEDGRDLTKYEIKLQFAITIHHFRSYDYPFLISMGKQKFENPPGKQEKFNF